jgi:hypothetical protein
VQQDAEILHYNDQVKEGEMGKSYTKALGDEECIYDIGGKVRRKETTRKT